MSEAVKNIKERASIRWSSGLSDSLLNAVICNIKPLTDKSERNSAGNIILRPIIDWDIYLKKYQ